MQDGSTETRVLLTDPKGSSGKIGIDLYGKYVQRIQGLHLASFLSKETVQYGLNQGGRGLWS